MNSKETETEQWKDIESFEGKYKISSSGRIMSYYRTPHFVKLQISDNGDVFATLVTNVTGKGKTIMVGKEVAKAFVPNPENYKYISFKDGNKLNCHADNIEWVKLTDTMQNSYNIRNKEINQYTPDGIYIRTWKSAQEIANHLNISKNSVCQACNGYRGFICGYIWRYKEEYPSCENIHITFEPKTSAVNQYTTDGIFLKKYDSISDAVKAIGGKASAGNISSCCKGNRNTAYGYIYQYAKD